MTNENLHVNGWRAAQKFSFKSAYLQLEIDQLKKENEVLRKRLEELRAEVQRLEKIAQY